MTKAFENNTVVAAISYDFIGSDKVEFFANTLTAEPYMYKVGMCRITRVGAKKSWISIKSLAEFWGVYEEEVADIVERMVYDYSNKPKPIVEESKMKTEISRVGVIDDSIDGYCTNPMCSGHSSEYIEFSEGIEDIEKDIKLAHKRLTKVDYAMDDIKNEFNINILFPEVDKMCLLVKKEEMKELTKDEQMYINKERNKVFHRNGYSLCLDLDVKPMWEELKGDYWKAYNEHKELNNDKWQFINARTALGEGYKSHVTYAYNFDSEKSYSEVICVYCGHDATVVPTKGHMGHLGVSKDTIEKELAEDFDLNAHIAHTTNELKRTVRDRVSEMVKANTKMDKDIDVSEIMRRVAAVRNGEELSTKEFNALQKKSFETSKVSSATIGYKDDLYDSLEASYLRNVDILSADADMLTSSTRNKKARK